MGCPLSPLMAAIYLKPLDDRMVPLNLFYVRFMDDWLVLAPTRWKLRAAVKCVNGTMAELKVEQHPNKTFVGRISRGFDFLGYRISSAGLIGLATQSVQQTVERINQLYEQGADEIRIGQYVRRWWAWVRGGICREFPPELLPLVLRETMGSNAISVLLGDRSPPAPVQATDGQEHKAQAGRFRDIGAGPGVAHHIAGCE